MSWHEPDSRYHVPIKRREVDIYFTDGTHVTDVLNMILQDGTERVIDRVEIDGETLSKERTCEVVSSRFDEMVGEWCIELSCGHCVWDRTEPPNYCQECGARLTDG